MIIDKFNRINSNRWTSFRVILFILLKNKLAFIIKVLVDDELAYFLFYIKKSLVNLEKQNDKKYS